MAGSRLNGQGLFPATYPELFGPTSSSGPGSHMFSYFMLIKRVSFLRVVK